jgi:putative ABC transport system permease protein
VADALRRNLGPLGLEVRGTGEVLGALLGVQNTYVATFLALGGLGLILGTVGLASAVLRSGVERRKELAIMTALGFTRARLAWMLVGEHGALLIAGVGLGVVSALVAVAPEATASGSRAPWGYVAGLIAAAAACGALSCGAAARWAVRGPLVGALRSE